MDFMRSSTRRKRRLVLETALRLFAEKGFENVSVEDIIHTCQISKGTFYHYFHSKEDLIAEVSQMQMKVVEQWLADNPLKVQSLEGHLNRLFIDLGSSIQPYPKLIRSMLAHAYRSESAPQHQKELDDALRGGLHRWLPEPYKADFLLTVYYGTVMKWCEDGEGREQLAELLRTRLAVAWNGLREAGDGRQPPPLRIEMKEEPAMRTAVIGGGLAGLTAAAYLSESEKIEGVLFERSPQLGGRAFTYEKSGFTLNYGAHAIYGIDRHTITRIEKELGLSFSSKQVDKRKVMYEKHDQLTAAPLDFVNLLRTELLSTREKVRFVAEITAIIANIHNVKHYPTLGDYLAESDADEQVKELWEHLVCSNFFITPEEARKVPGPVISEYYHNLFLSQSPVNYILGSWAVVTNQLEQKIRTSNRWSIAMREAVEGIRYKDRRFLIRTKEREEAFDRIVFAMPVQQIVKLMKDTPWEPFLAPYENSRPTEVMVYDVGLSRVVARPFSYISDMNNKLFISDVSATDRTLIPEDGQLLQGIAYLNDSGIEDENERKSYLDSRTTQMEQLFDRHYPGWRDAVAVKRVSKRAMVQSVKHVAGNPLLPVRLENLPFYFCGDGCEGKGELAERAFSSAREAARLIMKEAEQTI